MSGAPRLNWFSRTQRRSRRLSGVCVCVPYQYRASRCAVVTDWAVCVQHQGLEEGADHRVLERAPPPRIVACSLAPENPARGAALNMTNRQQSRMLWRF